MIEKIAVGLVVGLVSGGLSSIGTISAMDVHINYIKEELVKHERQIDRLEQKYYEVK